MSNTGAFESTHVLHSEFVFMNHTLHEGGPGSSVGTAAELRPGRFGIESQWGRDFQAVQTGPGVHPASCKMGTGSFPGVEAAGAWG